jgi:hypothetical protein
MCSDANLSGRMSPSSRLSGNLSGRLSQSSCSALSAGFMGTVPAPLSARTRFGQHRGGVPLLPLHHSSEQQVSAARQYLEKLRLQADEAEAHQRIASARVQVLQEEARILKDDALEQSASARERDKQLWLSMMRRIEEAKELEEASVAAKHMADVEAERVLARVEQSKRSAELEWERVRARESEIRALIAESLASDGITDSARDWLKQLLQTSYHPERSPSELSDSTPSGSARGSACNTPVSSTHGVVVGTSSASSFTSFSANLPRHQALPPPHRLPAPLVSHVEQMVEQASLASRQRPSETEGESSTRLHRLRHAAAQRHSPPQRHSTLMVLAPSNSVVLEANSRAGAASLRVRLRSQTAADETPTPDSECRWFPTPGGSWKPTPPRTPALSSQEETTSRVRGGATQRVRGSVTPLLTSEETLQEPPALWSQEETTFRVRGGATQRVRGPVTPLLTPQLTPRVRGPVTPLLTPGETTRVRGPVTPHRASCRMASSSPNLAPHRVTEPKPSSPTSPTSPSKISQWL